MERIKRRIERVTTFDLMRGYFMVAIIIDHLRFFPNGLDWWAMRGGLFVTAAEGFFLISGLVLGIVRGAKLIDKPMSVVSKILLKRGVQLYLTVVVLALVFTAIGWLYVNAGATGVKPGLASPDMSIWQVILSAFSLQYYYGWADYLRLYAIFLFVSPLAFWLLRRMKWYLVLLISLAVWAIYPLLLPYQSGEYWQPVSWQLIFFIGVIAGFHWNNILDAWRSLTKRVQRIIIVSTVSIASITIAINVGIMLSTMGYNMGSILTPQLQHDLYVTFFDKERMPLTRLLLALIWFGAGFYIFQRFEKGIRKVLGWLLLPFGTNSLYVYTLHAFAVFFVHIHLSSGPLWWNFLVTTGVIIVIRLFVHYKILMKIIPR